MKEKTVRAIVLAVVALPLVLALAAWNRGPSLSTESGRITATGDAEVRVVPDEVILTRCQKPERPDRGCSAGPGQRLCRA
jgi:uncharacterized protein YggE